MGEREERKEGEVLIVGGGVFGLTAAIELKRRSIERNEEISVKIFDVTESLPNAKSSSSDYNRIIRADYGDQEKFMDLTFEAIKGWEEWNKMTGKELFHPVGFLVLKEREMQSKDFEFESFMRMKNKVSSLLSSPPSYPLLLFISFFI